MRNNGHQFLDGKSASGCREEFGEGFRPDYDDESRSPFWAIRNRGVGKANDGFYFDCVSLKPEKESTARIMIRGNLNSNALGRLNRVLNSRMLATVQTWIVDCSRVNFISMEGIFGLIEASIALEVRGANLLLTDLQSHAMRIIKIWNALPAIQVFSSRQEMKDYFAAMQKESLKEQYTSEAR